MEKIEYGEKKKSDSLSGNVGNEEEVSRRKQNREWWRER